MLTDMRSDSIRRDDVRESYVSTIDYKPSHDYDNNHSGK